VLGLGLGLVDLQKEAAFKKPSIITFGPGASQVSVRVSVSVKVRFKKEIAFNKPSVITFGPGASQVRVIG
jgi:hypothetical protein